MKKFMLLLTILGFTMTAFSQEVLKEEHIAKIMKVANEGEINAAQVANRRSKNEKVKTFAAKMKKDHKMNKKEVKKTARKEDIDMEKSDMMKALKETNKATVKKLKHTPDAEFDRAYMASQVEMHQSLLDNLNQKFIPAATTPKFKTFLEETRTHVENHLQEAKSIQSTL